MQCVTNNNHKSSHEKIGFHVVLYWTQCFFCKSTASVSDFLFSPLFANDNDIFIIGEDMNVICNQLNEDLRKIQEWLQCNELSLNIRKTNYIVFTPRNRLIKGSGVKIHDVQILMFYATTFLGVPIDSQLAWKCIWSTHARGYRNVLAFFKKPRKNKCVNQLILFLCIPKSYLLQPCMWREQLPLLP